MRHRQAIAILALVGCFVALYLWLFKIGAIGTLQCGTGSCEYVQTSRYSDFLGLPVAFYGVGGYAILFGVSVVGLQPRFVARRGPTLVLVVLASVGFGFTVYLTYVELFVLHALCRWCVASGVVMTVIWVVAGAAALRNR